MSDLISRSELMTMLTEVEMNNGNFTEAKSKLRDIPTVEARPTVYGKWLYDKRKDRVYCSCCNNYARLEWNETAYEISELVSNFCPECGADIRGVKNELC